MSSINNNPGAMIALDALKATNRNLSQVQSEISTGKTINSAKDNAAIWSIATVMETDVASFEQISNSLNLGSATVGVARSATEDIVGYIQEAKNLIISAQEENVDRAKIQTDIDALAEQVQSTVGAAQFNGQNLLSSDGNVTILSSLDRAADGTVTAGQISVERQNLTNDVGVTTTITATGAGSGAATVLNGGAVGANATVDIFQFETGVQPGNSYALDVAGTTVTVTAAYGDSPEDMANKLVEAINTAGITNITAAVDGTNGNTVELINAAGSAATNSTAGTQTFQDGRGTLAGFDSIDVTTTNGATEALSVIEGFLTAAIDAAAEFGSKQKRIDNQADFVSGLADSLKTGVSTLTDADLEETSARLQALQVQQQLGVQALSIANQAPQSLLSLFQ
ncbi:MAG: flagellin [Litorimonas sp.]